MDKVGKENSTNIKIGILLAVGEGRREFIVLVIHLHSTILKFSMNYWLSFVTKPRTLKFLAAFERNPWSSCTPLHLSLDKSLNTAL